MNYFAGLPGRIKRVLASPRFFRVTVAILVLEAVWIALSGRYPMAFDEDFHLGLIKLYADHASPFWSAHPAGGDAYGALTRDPSYLFQYLMSFPYRFVRVFTHNQTAAVLALRAIDIAMFTTGFVLWRKVLQRVNISSAISNAILAIFVLIPIVPLLAAQINYDNLIFPMAAGCLLLTMSLAAQLKTHTVSTPRVLSFIVLSLFAAITKYAFLPMLLGMVVYLVIVAIRTRKSGLPLRKQLIASSKTASRRVMIVLGVFVLISGVLNVERYGVNLIRYHTLVPDCAQVLDLSHCSAYGPWIRDYIYTAEKPDDFGANPLSYSAKWVQAMWMRSFFAVDGPGTGFETRGPLAVPAITAAVISVLALAAAAIKARTLMRRKDASTLGLFTLVTGIYVATLWVQEYAMFRQTGQPVAINGRYLLLVAPLIMLIGALGLQALLKRKAWLNSLIVTIALVGMIWGGGVLTYILRSNDRWYWDNGAVRTTNSAVRNAIGPVTPGYHKPLLFLYN